MRCKAGIQQAILPAAFVLLFASTAQAAAELKDRPVSLSTPSSDSSSANPPAIEPLDPNAPPVEPRKKRKKDVPLTPDAPPVAPENAVPLDPNAPRDKPEKYVPFDPNAPPRAHIPIGPDLYFGGFASLQADMDRNRSLNTQPDDANSQFTPSVSLSFAYDPNRYIHVFTNATFGKSTAFEETKDKTQTVDLTLKQAYLALNNIIEGTSLSIGRQRVKDSRRWLFNDTLDAARLAYKNETLSMEFSASKLDIFKRELLGPDPTPSGETGKFINYYANINYKFAKKSRVDAFAIYQDGDTQYPMFFGIQSEGELVKHLNYWVQSAMVRGTDSSRRIRGEAVDVGLTQVFGPRESIRPSITVGYAYGSGDGNPNDSVDTAFRQTGFQDNSDSYNGIVRTKYYGEVLDPELTNLMVFTGGAGLKPSLRSSVDLVYHYYLREFSSTSIPRSGLNNVGLTGTDKHLGEEIDLIIGYQEIERVTIRLKFGLFMPGKAFAEPVRTDAREPAYAASILIRYFF